MGQVADYYGITGKSRNRLQLQAGESKDNHSVFMKHSFDFIDAIKEYNVKEQLRFSRIQAIVISTTLRVFVFSL